MSRNYVFDSYINFLLVHFLGSEYYFNDETAEVSFAGFNVQLEPVEDLQKCKFVNLHQISFGLRS